MFEHKKKKKISSIISSSQINIDYGSIHISDSIN